MTSMQPIDQAVIDKYIAVMDRTDITWDEKYRILWRTQHVSPVNPEATIRSHLEWMRSMQSK